MKTVQLTFDFNLPSSNPQEVGEPEFFAQIDEAIKSCNRFSMISEVCQGRALGTTRDYLKESGDAKGTRFSGFLKDKELTKVRAYKLIETADKAEELFGDRAAEVATHLTKPAFAATIEAAPEVQELVKASAIAGNAVTKPMVRLLSDEWDAKTSDLLPENIKARIQSGSIPARKIAPLVRELKKLPDTHAAAIKQELEEAEDPIAELKPLTAQAKSLTKYLDAAGRVAALSSGNANIELALEEALTINSLDIAANLVKQASQLENSAAKFYLAWKRLGDLSDRLYVETGAKTPNLRAMMVCLDRLTSEIVKVAISDDKTVRLQVLDEGSVSKIREQIRREVAAEFNEKIAQLESQLDRQASPSQQEFSNLQQQALEQERDGALSEAADWHNRYAEEKAKIALLEGHISQLNQEIGALSVVGDSELPSETYPAGSLKVSPQILSALQVEIEHLTVENQELQSAVAPEEELLKVFNHNLMQAIGKALNGEGDPAPAAELVAIATGTKLSDKTKNKRLWMKNRLEKIHPGLFSQLIIFANDKTA